MINTIFENAMPEVPHVGPTNPVPPPPERKETSSTERFDEHMRKDRVTQSDAEEQKKRKHAHETESERKAEETTTDEKSAKKAKKTPEAELQFTLKKEGPVKESRRVSGAAPSEAEPVSGEKVEKKEKVEKEELLPAAHPLSEPAIVSSPLPPATIEESKKVSAPPPLPPAVEEKKVEEKAPVVHEPQALVNERAKVKEKTAAFETALSTFSAPQTSAPTPEAKVTKAYANFSAQVLDIFERMVGVMTVADKSGIKETTIHLTGPRFASSVFNGCQIIIQEHSSAPKSFNVQLVGNPQAVQEFEAKIPMILGAFHSGNYDFKINRLEANLVKEGAPVLQRKESPSDKTWDEGQQGNKKR